MFDSATATFLFFVLVVSYSWFSTTDFCDRLFTLPGRLLIGVVLFVVAAVYLPEAKADTNDNLQIRQVVETQIRAFEDGDRLLAFALLSVEAKRVTKNPQEFYEFVADTCRVLVEHDPKVFVGAAYSEGDHMIQPVMFTLLGSYTAVLFVVSKNLAGWWQIEDFLIKPLKIKSV